MTYYHASRCPCGHPVCKDWHVDGVAAVQGVHFTEEQAYMVASLLNAMDRPRIAAGNDLLTAALALNDQLQFHDDHVTYEGGMNQAEAFRELVNKLWHERQGWRKPA